MIGLPVYLGGGSEPVVLVRHAPTLKVAGTRTNIATEPRRLPPQEPDVRATAPSRMHR